MPTAETSAPKRVRKPLPSDLSDLDRLILERQDDGFDRIVEAIDKLTARTPDPRMVLAGIGSLLVGVFVVVVYCVTLIAEQAGVDTRKAVESTSGVVETLPSAPAAPAPDGPPGG